MRLAFNLSRPSKRRRVWRGASRRGLVPRPNTRMTLLDRLIGYGSGADDKLPLHQYMDALFLRDSGGVDVPSDAEMIRWFGLSPAELNNSNTIQALLSGMHPRSPRSKAQAAMRLAESFPDDIRKPRLRRMMGLPVGGG